MPLTYEVWCDECNTPVNTKDVKVLNVEEGPDGNDVAVFCCPQCHEQRRSHVVSVYHRAG
jgi:RNase P subunit RPR2